MLVPISPSPFILVSVSLNSTLSKYVGNSILIRVGITCVSVFPEETPSSIACLSLLFLSEAE